MATKTLVSGEKVKINDYTTSHRYEIHVHIESSMTIDFCCFGLDADRQLSDDGYMIFYNQPASPEKAISLSQSDPRKTVFQAYSKNIPEKIKNLTFTASIDGNGTMSNIKRGYLAVFADQREILRFDFSGQDFNNERAIIIGEIYFKDVWRLGAVGQGFNGGLSALLKHFGGEEIIEENPPTTHLGDGYKYYYSQLNEPIKKAYEEMVKGMKSFSENIHIGYTRDINDSTRRQLMESINLDNPSIYDLRPTYQYTSDGHNIWFNPGYTFNKSMSQERESRLFNMADKILKEVINGSMDDYEKELALHDYLAKNVFYDYDSLSIQNPPEEIYSAYGALINKRAVCSGFSHAMKLLLDRCEIDCLIVTGDSKIPGKDNSVGHAWNIVKVKSKFYHLDVTWDAPIEKREDNLQHHYFNITDEEIAVDHTWESNTPKCNSSEHNYYTYQGLTINDESTLKKKIKKAIEERHPVFQFKYNESNSGKMDNNKLNRLIENTWRSPDLMSMIFGGSSGSLGWETSYNDRQKVYKVKFQHNGGRANSGSWI